MAALDVSYLYNLIATDVYETAPTVLLALFLVLFGWILSRITKKITTEVLKKIKVDENFKLAKEIQVSDVVATCFSWVINLVFIGSAINTLKISTLSLFFDTIINFVTSLLGGIFILTIGYAIAAYVQKKISKTKMAYSQVFGQIVFSFTMIITIEMALRTVGLPTALLDIILVIIIGSIGLGLAIAVGLAFGLGLKDVISKLVKKYLGV